MNVPEKAATPLHQLPLYEVRIAGKIQQSRKHESHYYTLIVSPAKDEYSSPSRFQLRSKNKLGDKEEVLNVRCSLAGAVRELGLK